MKGALKFLIVAVVSASLGWVAGFLRFPAVEKNNSFWLGFVACSGMVLLAMVLLSLRKKNHLAGTSRLSGKMPPLALMRAMLAVIVLGGGLGGWAMYQQGKQFDRETQALNHRIEEQAELIASIRNGNLGLLIADVMRTVDQELERDPARRLTDGTIDRISTLAYSLKPYRYFAGDSLAEKSLSPERGLLLASLAVRDIDSLSFLKVKRSSTFAGADLRGADLRGLDLREVDLRGSSLKEADLTGADLSGADLFGGELWGANLNKTSLVGANLRRSDLRWAEMNEADLSLANLNGADMSSAKLRKSKMRGATMHWGQADGAVFIAADLSCVDFFGTRFTMANLSQANLNEANLKEANMKEARLMGADLDGVACAEGMLDMIDDWRIAEAAEIRARYRVVQDPQHIYVTAGFKMVPR